MLRGLRGRTNTTTNSPGLEASAKTAQFYDIRFCIASFGEEIRAVSRRRAASPQRKQGEGRNYDPLLVLARKIVK